MYFVPSGLVAFASLLVAILDNPRLPHSALFLVALVAILCIGVLTFHNIMPLNNRLKSMLRRAEKKSGKANQPSFSVDEADEALLGVNRWIFLNRVRIMVAAISWATTIVAILI
jgi:hypothetical protein